MRVGHFFVLFRHSFGTRGRFLQMRIDFGEARVFCFEEIVHVAHRCTQVDFVGGFAQAANQAAEQIDFLARFGAQILIVFEEHFQVLIDAEHRMRCQSWEKHFVHGNGFLECGQIFAANWRSKS